MFTQLSEIIKHPLTLSISYDEDKGIMSVSVRVYSTKSNYTPMTVSGTPEELDNELIPLIKEKVEKHFELTSSTEEAIQQAEEIDKERKKELEEKKNKGKKGKKKSSTDKEKDEAKKKADKEKEKQERAEQLKREKEEAKSKLINEIETYIKGANVGKVIKSFETYKKTHGVDNDTAYNELIKKASEKLGLPESMLNAI